MTRHTLVLFWALLLATASIGAADQLVEGDVELQFRFTHSNFDFDGSGGSTDFTEVVGIIEYMLTDHHEIGGGVAYAEVDGSDSLEFGGNYTYNFRAGTDLNPYLAVQIVGFGGDRGDLFDIGYGAEAGLKVYPWAHAGALFGLNYRELIGSDGVPAATNLNLFGGVILKF